MKENRLLRFVVMIGPGEEKGGWPQGFLLAGRKRDVSSEILCADITGDISGQDNFLYRNLYSSGILQGRRIGDFDELRDIFVYYGISETWNLITGDIKPSCCIYKYGMLFVPETEVCLGLVSENANFPRGYDMKDLGRVERLLEKTGVFKIPDEISLAEIETKLSKFSEIEKFLDEFSAKDEETLLR